MYAMIYVVVKAMNNQKKRISNCLPLKYSRINDLIGLQLKFIVIFIFFLEFKHSYTTQCIKFNVPSSLSLSF